MSIDELTALVTNVQKQQGDSYDYLYSYSYPLIRSYVMRLGATPDEADDITQESILKIHLNIEKLREPICYKKWMYRIAYTCFHTYQRCKREILLDGQECNIAETRSYMIPETYLEESSMNKQLKEALYPLQRNLQEIIILRYLNELSEKEIAEVTHLPHGTVKSRLFYARRKLQAAY